jgi:hypothetical protein
VKRLKLDHSSIMRAIWPASLIFLRVVLLIRLLEKFLLGNSSLRSGNMFCSVFGLGQGVWWIVHHFAACHSHVVAMRKFLRFTLFLPLENPPRLINFIFLRCSWKYTFAAWSDEFHKFVFWCEPRALGKVNCCAFQGSRVHKLTSGRRKAWRHVWASKATRCCCIT